MLAAVAVAAVAVAADSRSDRARRAAKAAGALLAGRWPRRAATPSTSPRPGWTPPPAKASAHPSGASRCQRGGAARRRRSVTGRACGSAVSDALYTRARSGYSISLLANERSPPRLWVVFAPEHSGLLVALRLVVSMNVYLNPIISDTRRPRRATACALPRPHNEPHPWPRPTREMCFGGCDAPNNIIYYFIRL